LGTATGELIEREETLGTLGIEVARGLAGEGRLILVEGEAGVGKTHVLDVAVGSHPEARVLRAVAGQYEGDLAFGVARQLLGAEAFAAGRPVPADVDVGAVLDDLYLRVLALADERPLLLVVDDLHWADRPSVRLLAYLARRLDRAPLALLAGVRTGAGDLAVLREPGLGAVTIGLRPLSADGSARLLVGLLGEARARDLSGACHQASGGNPFLLQTIARSLAEDGDATATDQETLARGAAADVDFWVRAQIEGLGVDATAVLEAIAVVGDAAPLATVARIADCDRAATAAAVDALVAAGLLQPDGRGFAHPLVHAAVREGIPVGRRALLTGRAARTLAAEQGDVARAASLLRGMGPLGEPWAGQLLAAAGEQAMREGAPAEAADLWRHCLAEPLAPVARFETTLALGALECAQGEVDGLSRLIRAGELAPDPAGSARAALARARVLQLQGEVDAKIALLEAELGRLGDAAPELAEEIEGELALLAVTATSLRARTLPRLRRLTAMVEEGDPPGNPVALAAVAAELAMNGRCAEGVRWATEARRRLDGEADGGATGPIISSVLYISEAWAEAEAHYEMVIADPRRSAFLAADALTGRALIWLFRGDVLEAEAAARAALRLRDDHIVQPLKYAVLADSLVEQDRVAEALEVTAGVAEPSELDQGTLGQMLVGARARVLFVAGRHAEALAAALRARDFEREWGGANPHMLRWREPATSALAALGEIEEARALAAESLGLFGDAGMPIAGALARRTVAVLAPGGPDVEELAAVVADLDSEFARLEQARTLLELGAALRVLGQIGEARKELAAARELAHECGSVRLERRAREELVATGARPRRVALSGRAALTPAEGRVVDLAATGLTNPAIAALLVISRRTVEMHLSNAYRKLDIASRKDLPEALRP
jgi:DNA-binding CsgD family transcriptional regulator